MPKIKPNFPEIKARWFLFIPTLLEVWVMFVLGLASMFLFDKASSEFADAFNNVIMLVASLFSGIFILFWARKELRRYGASFRALLGPLPSFKQLVGYGLLVVAASTCGGALLMAVFYGFYLLNPGFAKNVIEGAENSFSYSYGYMVANILLTIAVAVVAPFFEELTFRGFILQRWCAKWGYSWGIILTSLVFALFHGETMFAIFPFALVLAVTYIRTKSLYVTMWMHMVNNLIASVMMFASLLSTHGARYDFDSTNYFEGMNVLLGIGGIATCIVGAYLYRAWPRRGELLPLEYNRQKLEELDPEHISA